MAENVENIILAHLRAIHSIVERTEAEVLEIKLRLAILDVVVGRLRSVSAPEGRQAYSNPDIS